MGSDPRIKKRMRNMLIVLAVLFGGIFIYKAFLSIMIKLYISSNHSPVVPVSAIKVQYTAWQPQITAVGSLRAIRGVNVTTELAAMVAAIYFTPGALVEKNTLLVQLNVNSDLALLHSLEANAALAKITYWRDKAQYAAQAVSRQTLDNDEANLKSLQAQVAQQAATIAKKTIRAPFSGRLGVSAVNPGQYVNPGDTITMLQTLDPIYADFYVPQQALAEIKMGQAVTVTADTYPGKLFKGKITTINPAVDVSTRNVLVEATIPNAHEELAPGMFANIVVDTGALRRYLTLPQTAISFNPYGELVYVIRSASGDHAGKPVLTATQVFVTTGETRGDQIAVLKGLKAGDLVVTSGQLKLKNGNPVVISNAVPPANSANPQAPDEH